MVYLTKAGHQEHSKTNQGYKQYLVIGGAWVNGSESSSVDIEGKGGTQVLNSYSLSSSISTFELLFLFCSCTTP